MTIRHKLSNLSAGDEVLMGNNSRFSYISKEWPVESKLEPVTVTSVWKNGVIAVESLTFQAPFNMGRVGSNEWTARQRGRGSKYLSPYPEGRTVEEWEETRQEQQANRSAQADIEREQDQIDLEARRQQGMKLMDSDGCTKRELPGGTLYLVSGLLTHAGQDTTLILIDVTTEKSTWYGEEDVFVARCSAVESTNNDRRTGGMSSPQESGNSKREAIGSLIGEYLNGWRLTEAATSHPDDFEQT